MASRHRARKSTIQIVRTGVVPAADCKRKNTIQFQVGDSVGRCVSVRGN